MNVNDRKKGHLYLSNSKLMLTRHRNSIDDLTVRTIIAPTTVRTVLSLAQDFKYLTY